MKSSNHSTQKGLQTSKWRSSLKKRSVLKGSYKFVFVIHMHVARAPYSSCFFRWRFNHFIMYKWCSSSFNGQEGSRLCCTAFLMSSDLGAKLGCFYQWEGTVCIDSLGTLTNCVHLITCALVKYMSPLSFFVSLSCNIVMFCFAFLCYCIYFRTQKKGI